MINKVKPTQVLEEIIVYKQRYGFYPTKYTLRIILNIGEKQLNNLLNYLQNKDEIKLYPHKYRGIRLKHDDR